MINKSMRSDQFLESLEELLNMQKVETQALETTISGRYFSKEDKFAVYEYIEANLPEEFDTLQERSFIFIKLLLLKFCEHTLESITED